MALLLGDANRLFHLSFAFSFSSCLMVLNSVCETLSTGMLIKENISELLGG